MATLSQILDAHRLPEREETLLEQAVRREMQRIDIKRMNLMKSVCSSHRTSGTAPVPSNSASPVAG